MMVIGETLLITFIERALGHVSHKRMKNMYIFPDDALTVRNIY